MIQSMQSCISVQHMESHDKCCSQDNIGSFACPFIDTQGVIYCISNKDGIEIHYLFIFQ